MATLAPELLDWIEARSTGEKEALFGRLAREVVSQRGKSPVAVYDESDRTVAYLFPGDDSSAWPLPSESPARLAELRRRIDTPGETVPFDDFIDRLQTAAR